MTRRAKEWRSILEASEFRLRPQETIKGCLEDGAGLSIRVSNQHVSASRELLGTSLSEYYSQLGCVHHVARYHPPLSLTSLDPPLPARRKANPRCP